MIDLATGWMGIMADWSLRWGVLIVGLMVVLAAARPRAVAARLWLGRLVLIGGLLLPLWPRWWAAPLPEFVASRASVSVRPTPTDMKAEPSLVPTRAGWLQPPPIVGPAAPPGPYSPGAMPGAG